MCRRRAVRGIGRGQARRLDVLHVLGVHGSVGDGEWCWSHVEGCTRIVDAQESGMGRDAPRTKVSGAMALQKLQRLS